ncbi:reticulon-1-like protein [Dermatophagoides farinae]|uniref:Reticulon-like protein n=1 Tax=Dermatophagoides farinae TaxID=6954 RepID=A0A9D4P1Y7_DERFA|nr:reticulon-1-like protein [Dermatophagoides farinae]
MENSPSDNDKLIDVPTFIDSTNSAVDQSRIPSNFYELDSNFSIMNVDNNKGEGDENKKVILENIGEVEENSNISILDNLKESKLDPDPNNPDDYIIKPEKHIDHFVDLEYKPDPFPVIDSPSVKPNSAIDIQPINPNVRHDSPEKLKTVLTISIVNQITYSDYSRESDALDSSLNTNDFKSDQPVKIPVKEDELVKNESLIGEKIADDEMKMNSQANDGSTVFVDNSNDSVVSSSTDAQMNITKSEQTLQEPLNDSSPMSSIKKTTVEDDVTDRLSEQFPDFASKEMKPIVEPHHEEPLIVEQTTAFTHIEPIPISAVLPTQNIDQTIDENPVKLSSFKEEENSHPNLKPEHAEIVDIPQDSKPEYVEPLIVKPVEEKLVEKMDQALSPSEKTDLFSEKSPTITSNVLQSDQNPIGPEATLVPENNLFSSNNSDNVERKESFEIEKQEKLQTSSSSSFQMDNLRFDDAIKSAANMATGVVEKPDNLMSDASTFSPMMINEPDRHSNEAFVDYDKVATSAAAAAFVEEAIATAKTVSSGMISDFMPTSASIILSPSVDIIDTNVCEKVEGNIEDSCKKPIQVSTTSEKLSSAIKNDQIDDFVEEKEEPVNDHHKNSEQQETDSVDIFQESSSTVLVPEQKSSKEEKQQQQQNPIENEQKIMGRKNYRQYSSDNSAAANNLEPDCVQNFIHSLFGQCAADILYWRDPKNSGAVFGVGLVILFSLTVFSVISVVAYTLLFTLLASLTFRVYKNVMQAVNKTDDGHPFKEYLEVDITPNQEKAHEIADQILSHFNCFVNRMRSVLLVEDYVESFKYLFMFWALTFIGAWFNGMTLVILAYIGAFSLPKVYEMNQAQIDHYINMVVSKINEVTEKIPFLKKASAAAEKKDN